MENKIFIPLVIATTLAAACSSENGGDNTDQYSASARAQYELSENELEDLKGRYKNGDSEAAYKIAQHYSSLGPRFTSEYIDWLDNSFKLKNKKSGIELLSSLVLMKNCEKYKENKEIFDKLFGDNDISVQEIEKNYLNLCQKL